MTSWIQRYTLLWFFYTCLMCVTTYHKRTVAGLYQNSSEGQTQYGNSFWKALNKSSTHDGYNNPEKSHNDMHFGETLREGEIRVNAGKAKSAKYVTYNRSGQGLLVIPSDIPHRTESLDLSHNQISEILNFSFVHLTNLLFLNLTGNRIRQMQMTAFSGLKFLVWLDLSKNNMQSQYFPHTVFQPLHSLKDLYLHGNILPRLDANREVYLEIALSKLIYLNSLSLDGLPVPFFGSSFQLMRHLHTLYLGFNGGWCETKFLLNETFQNFKSLNSLYLSDCDLRNIQPLAFGPLADLLELDLSNNTNLYLKQAIRSLGPFRNRKMKRISMQSVNPAAKVKSKLENGLLYTSLSAGDALYLTAVRVKHLDLSYNSLVVIDADVFRNQLLNSIVRLELQGNSLTNSTNTTNLLRRLSSANMLNDLDLSSQKTSSANDNDIRADDIKTWTGEVKNNPVYKETEGSPLLFKDDTNHVLPPNLIKLNLSNFNNMSGPQIVKNIRFTGKNVLKQVDISYNGPVCYQGVDGLASVIALNASGSRCSVWNIEWLSRSFPSLTEFYLDNANLANDLGHSLILANLRKLVSISLASNGFWNFHKDFFQSQVKLERLFISNNKFDHVPLNLSQFVNLKELDLSYNNIQYLPQSITKQLDLLINTSGSFYLHLRGNSFSCGCDALEFIEWLSKTKVSLDNNGDYNCKLKNGVLSTTFSAVKVIDRLRLQCLGIWILDIAIGVSSGCILVIILASVFIRYKWTLKYFFLKIRGRMKWYDDLTLDESSLRYDVFVAYSSRDYDWVVDELMQHLEEDSGLRLCVYHRDFNGGEYIEQSILEAINFSRGSIFVVTENYLQSDWIDFEMRMVSLRCLEMRSYKVIVILLDNLSPSRLPQYLRTIWSKIVCLPWTEGPIGQRQFWRKLQHSCRSKH